MLQAEPSAFNQYSFLAGGGEMGELIRSYNWEATSLGSPEHWPQSLKTCVRIILTSSQPMFVWWGPELINIYNDPYQSIVGGKHPKALGQPAEVVWREIWSDIEPRVNTVLHQNTGTYDESLLLIMHRYGYEEETYYTFSYSPVPGEDGTPAGIICANTDDTDRIVGARQLRTLKDLAKQLTDTKSNKQIFRKTIQVLEENPQDFPFAVLYTIKDEEKLAVFEGMTGSKTPYEGVQSEIDLTSANEVFQQMAKVAETGKPYIVHEVQNKFGIMPSGSWNVPPDKAMILSVAQSGQKNSFAFLVVGMNPYRLLDDKYESFFQLVADQVATSLSNVKAYEDERKRAEALAEIDRAKTLFFSNISHEFRTPLTLMLSPLEEIKQQSTELPAIIKENLDIAHRNTLRLQKLVNTLLDFSRIEAGRMDARFQPVNLAELTQDLASSFRSAMAKAGLSFEVVSTTLEDNIYVDVDMWEKIVLNLLSNALKYTHSGNVSVLIQQQGNQAQVIVKDSGVGIPDAEKDKIFQRFHRIQNTKGRSQEGTGIGLALVSELVKLHGGTIAVQSEEGVGSIFTINLPMGKQHLPPNQVVDVPVRTPASIKANAFLEEAGKWIADDIHTVEIAEGKTGSKKYTVLLADDNADMRDYVKRLLSNEYHVLAVENGKQVLEVLKEAEPDIIVSDVMMPEMDGFELVNRLKEHAIFSHIPVILLSARAGEEATVEGLKTGADDYLVKPFSAKELVSRIQSNIKIAKNRQAAEQNIRNLFMKAPVAFAMLKGKQFVIELVNEKALEIWGRSEGDVLFKPVLEAIPEIREQGFGEILEGVYKSGRPFISNEMPVELVRHGKREMVYINFTYEAMYHASGEIDGILAIGIDVTPQVTSRKLIEESEARFRDLIASSPAAIVVLKGEGMIISIANTAIIETWGKGEEIIGKSLFDVMPEIVGQGFSELLEQVYKTGRPYYGYEIPMQLVRDGKEEIVYYNFVYQANRNASGEIDGVAIIANEITPHALLKKKLEENEERLRLAAESAALGTWDYNHHTGSIYISERTKEIAGFDNDCITLEDLLLTVAVEDRRKVSEAIEEVLQQGVIEYHEIECSIQNQKTKDKIVIKLNGKGIADRSGKIMRLIGTVIDITEQKKAEDQLRQKTLEVQKINGRLQIALDAAKLGSYDLDIKAGVMYSTDQGKANFGLSADAAFNLDEFLQAIIEEDRDRIQQNLDVAIRDRVLYNTEYRVKWPDNSIHWIAASGRAVYDEKGEAVNMVGVTLDITERKMVEEELERRVRQRTNELAQANENLERSNKELEQFAFVSSHDLQEPLRKIQTFAHMLYERNLDELNDQGKMYLDKMMSASKRMSKLINDLLNFSRLQRSPERLVPTDLNKVLSNIENDFELLINQKGALIHAEKLPVIEANPLEMNQLFYNLLNNALKFSKDNLPPKIDIACKTLTIEEVAEHGKLAKGKTYYQIAIRDNGIGFSQEYALKIFEIFQRLNTQSEYEGTGIGLALVHKIVLNHQGLIYAQSEEGVGSSFYVILPATQTKTEE